MNESMYLLLEITVVAFPASHVSFRGGIRFFVFSWDVHLNGSVELRFHSTTCSKPLVNGLYLGESCPPPSFESLIRSTSNGNIQIQYAEKRQWQGINGIVHLEGVGNPILRDEN